MELTTITYDITECGFYRHGAQLPEGGELKYMLTELQKWAENRQVLETITYNPGPNRQAAYCQSITSDGDDWLITLFVSAEDGEGQIFKINGAETVNDVTAGNVVNAKENDIIGHPAFFHINTAKKVLRPIRYAFSTHMPLLRHYLTGFLTKLALSSALAEEDESGRLTMRESADEAESAVKTFPIYPKFDAKPKYVRDNLKTVESERTKISKVIRRGVLPQWTSTNQDKAQTFLNRMLGTGKELVKSDRQYKLELAYTPLPDELQELMAEAKNMEYRENIWVVINGNHHSLKSVYQTNSGTIDDGDGTPNPEKLMEWLKDNT